MQTHTFVAVVALLGKSIVGVCRNNKSGPITLELQLIGFIYAWLVLADIKKQNFKMELMEIEKGLSVFKFKC